MPSWCQPVASAPLHHSTASMAGGMHILTCLLLLLFLFLFLLSQAGGIAGNDDIDVGQVDLDLLDLDPKRAVESFKTEAGTIEVWEASSQPLILLAGVAASKLTLFSRSLALPAYSDSPKLHYVIKGQAIVGVVFPGTQQQYVRSVEAGDVVALPVGSVSWWYNPASSNLAVISLGDTSKAHRTGQFTDSPLAGRTSVVHGFSPDFLAQAWDVNETLVKQVEDNQKGAILVQLSDGDHRSILEAAPDRGGNIPETSYPPAYGQFIYSAKDAKKDPDVKGGGRVATITSDVLPILDHIQLGSDLVELDPGGQVSPGYSADAAFQVTYIVRGSGHVQIVSDKGKRVVDFQLTAGDFFIVPRFYIVSKRAGGQGLQWFSIITTQKPIFTNLAGSTSIFKALSPAVLRAALNLDEDAEKTFRQRHSQDPVFFPPLS